MVHITIKRNELGELKSLTVEGHAGFESEGGDIVCAAISALVGFLGLVFTELRPEAGSVSAEDGFFELSVVDLDSVQVTLDAWVLSVRQLEDNYRGWVKVVEEN